MTSPDVPNRVQYEHIRMYPDRQCDILTGHLYPAQVTLGQLVNANHVPLFCR